MKIKVSTCEWMRRASVIVTVATFLLFWLEGFGISKGGQRFIDLSQGNTAMWIFLILGAIIILLQLIPAIILFFNFVGVGAKAGQDALKIKEEKEEDPLADEIKF